MCSLNIKLTLECVLLYLTCQLYGKPSFMVYSIKGTIKAPLTKRHRGTEVQQNNVGKKRRVCLFLKLQQFQKTKSPYHPLVRKPALKTKFNQVSPQYLKSQVTPQLAAVPGVSYHPLVYPIHGSEASLTSSLLCSRVSKDYCRALYIKNIKFFSLSRVLSYI